MTHLTDDIQIFLVLGAGGSLAALAVCRAKYGADWFEPWVALTEFLSALGIAVIAVGEHAIIFAWWAAAPLLVSISIASVFAWLLTGWTLCRKSHVALDLELRGSTTETTNRGGFSRWMFYWGFASLVLLVASFVVALTRIR
jgi:hypothetical protein